MHALRLARAIAAVGLLALATGGCGSDAPGRDDGPFAYDRDAALELEESGKIRSGGVTIRDLSYAVPSGRVLAFLVTPPNAKDLPGVVYLPGTGGDRTEFLGPAIAMAGRGAAVLLVTPPSSGHQRAGATLNARLLDLHDTVVGDVVATRRAIDALQARPEVDGKRIALIGWSAGAHTAAIVAGADGRLDATVLMSAGTEDTAAYAAQAPPADRPQIREALEPIDPLTWLGRADPEAVLIQDGKKDEVVPRSALERMIAAAPKGTIVRWYTSGHDLSDAAYADHLAWLQARLGF
ncbi:MAG: prolyl oligopeptidase family serine peptidase [Gaiellales bacterium]